MVGLRTVALIERKPDITRDLFSRYWRDVHGVMAARIPGFARYVQHHVTPVGDRRENRNFEGVAIVAFDSDADRAGLGNSAVTRHIHRDEQNVFRRALLYNLDETGLAADAATSTRDHAGHGFVLVPIGVDGDAAVAAVRTVEPAFIDIYDLRSGDPAGWNDTDVDDGGEGIRFGTLVHFASNSPNSFAVLDATIDPTLGLYRVDDCFVMVADGFPTHLGLRGADALRTIEEAGASNQLEPQVVIDIYGAGLANVS
jgi:hypothetical protein